MKTVNLLHNASHLIETQSELLDLYYSQIVDLTMMSKIELGDDVIEEIIRLKKEIEKCYENSTGLDK